MLLNSKSLLTIQNLRDSRFIIISLLYLKVGT